MSLDADALRAAVAAHGAVARVVVAGIKGSVPREVGAAMLVWEDGQSGTIGGGALEFEAAARARIVLRDGTDRLDHAPLGPGLGQCCGGAVTLLTERFDAARLDHMEGAIFARPAPGGPAEMPLSVRQALRTARGEGHAASLTLRAGWVLEPMARATRPLWIYGAGHVGRALVHTLAPLPDFAITWVDTGPERFPEALPAGVTVLPAADPALAAGRASEDAVHLILTYSHALDLALCHALLSRPAAGIGLIGSATKWARFRSRLRQLGHADAQISRITCPIGDPALGKYPQAIAVGVASSLLSGQMMQSSAYPASAEAAAR
ncbi:xanthine dehydrogenase accessory protein XdhC [Dinoroseobacter sp. PD6]|uniref:xanthine dehydrogenase accessory protein XdhC n=1 Tax=Dinoroseobacter sp. PD6 TaxID=3028384 RepID=UPI00237ABD62|nr:xanthine dehydrogenase accessory protein XdhC [Dinoroseobacter sp. PD6]MDD9716864.1 xanthine dehydrogenase accessory protein XdhC [Dinoroseobacter sp. PD6]